MSDMPPILSDRTLPVSDIPISLSDIEPRMSDAETEMSDTETKPWSIRGIPPEERNAAIAAAAREGVNIGEWLRRAIRLTIQNDRQTDRAPAPILPEKSMSDTSNIEALERLTATALQAAEASGQPLPASVSRVLFARIREQGRRLKE